MNMQVNSFEASKPWMEEARRLSQRAVLVRDYWGCRNCLKENTNGARAPGTKGPEDGKARGSVCTCKGLKIWRRDRDSNPGYPFEYTRFPSVPLQPLGHLSVGKRVLQERLNRGAFSL